MAKAAMKTAWRVRPEVTTLINTPQCVSKRNDMDAFSWNMKGIQSITISTREISEANQNHGKY
jgi:hypothetical protein